MRRTTALAVLAGLALTGAASADIYYHTTISEVDAVTGQVLGTPFSFDWTRPSGQDPYQAHGASWGVTDPAQENPAPATFGNGAQLHGIGFAARQNPIVGLNFNVAANPLSNSTFVIDSVVVGSLGSITGALAQASAAVSVTNSGSIGNTSAITLLGLQGGGNLYSARYNGTNVFADLVAGPGSNVPQGSGVTQTFSGTTGGYLPYAGNPGLIDIRSQFRFTLSNGDRAAGTSTYELIIPAPSAMGVLALGGLVAARRRRN